MKILQTLACSALLALPFASSAAAAEWSPSPQVDASRDHHYDGPEAEIICLPSRDNPYAGDTGDNCFREFDDGDDASEYPVLGQVIADVTLTQQEMMQAGCTQSPDGTLHCTRATRPAQINMLQKKMDALRKANIAMPPSQKPAINPNTGKAP
jgi:hypothetical protein